MEAWMPLAVVLELFKASHVLRSTARWTAWVQITFLPQTEQEKTSSSTPRATTDPEELL